MESDKIAPQMPDPEKANPKNWWVIIPGTILATATLIGAISGAFNGCERSSQSAHGDHAADSAKKFPDSKTAPDDHCKDRGDQTPIDCMPEGK